MIKGGNSCEVKLKENNVLIINNIALKTSKEGNNTVKIRMTTGDGKSAFICDLNEKIGSYQIQTKLELLSQRIVSFEAIGKGDVYLSGMLFNFEQAN